MSPTPASLPRPNNTHAKPAICRCGATVLRGYDAPLIAAQATVDPIQATPAEEAAAWLTLHLGTWRLWGRPGHYELTRRTFPGQQALDVKTTALEVPVLIEHRCGSPPLATGPTVPLDPPDLTDLPDTPPY